ncbi:hypothetical protein HC762_01345 [bacterium]|nr:hypothetical protein [bacterium]
MDAAPKIRGLTEMMRSGAMPLRDAAGNFLDGFGNVVPHADAWAKGLFLPVYGDDPLVSQVLQASGVNTTGLDSPQLLARYYQGPTGSGIVTSSWSADPRYRMAAAGISLSYDKLGVMNAADRSAATLTAAQAFLDVEARCIDCTPAQLRELSLDPVFKTSLDQLIANSRASALSDKGVSGALVASQERGLLTVDVSESVKHRFAVNSLLDLAASGRAGMAVSVAAALVLYDGVTTRARAMEAALGRPVTKEEAASAMGLNWADFINSAAGSAAVETAASAALPFMLAKRAFELVLNGEAAVDVLKSGANLADGTPVGIGVGGLHDLQSRRKRAKQPDDDVGVEEKCGRHHLSSLSAIAVPLGAEPALDLDGVTCPRQIGPA